MRPTQNGDSTRMLYLRSKGSFRLSYCECDVPNFVRSSIHLIVRSLIHSIVHSFNHSLVHSSIQPFILSFIHSVIHTLIQSFIHLFVVLFTLFSFINSFRHSFIHSLQVWRKSPSCHPNFHRVCTNSSSTTISIQSR